MNTRNAKHCIVEPSRLCVWMIFLSILPSLNSREKKLKIDAPYAAIRRGKGVGRQVGQ